MPIESAFASIANTSPTLTALIGTAPVRFYPDAIPIDVVYPATAYQRIASVRQSRKLRIDRPLAGIPSQLVRTLFQITIHAKTASSRASVASAIRAAFVGISGTYGDTIIERILPPDGETDAFEPTTGIYQRFIDFAVWYREP